MICIEYESRNDARFGCERSAYIKHAEAKAIGELEGLDTHTHMSGPCEHIGERGEALPVRHPTESAGFPSAAKNRWFHFPHLPHTHHSNKNFAMARLRFSSPGLKIRPPTALLRFT